ncbi:MAG: 4Fe-4S dicluster domain-containing protein [Gemmatimonadota bacterium]|nr:4Fe-4S dicluster domain-containing protein [Gemmatimonadota bacterium]
MKVERDDDLRRDLQEFADSMLERSLEFPLAAALAPGELTRREFVTLLGASVALAGLGACVREPSEKILPYVHGSTDTVPGVALHFATSMPLDGYATGLLVTSHDGRPTKIEGNPDHPASLGAAGVFQQASVLQLYDPHRARFVQAGTRKSSWGALERAFAPAALKSRVGATGAGLRFLLEPTASPLIAAMLARVQSLYPDARTCFYSPLTSTGAMSASANVLGGPVTTLHDFTNADVVVSLGSDFCAAGPFSLRYARHFGARRRIMSPPSTLYVAECAPSPTGTLADHRVSASPPALGRVAAALLATIGSDARVGGRVPSSALQASAASIPLTPAQRTWVQAAAADLVASAGRGIVIAGEQQSSEVHAVAHALNAALGNAGKTVTYASSPLIAGGESGHDLATLVNDLEGGHVDTLVILEGNPAYGAPADVALARAVHGVRNSLYLGLYDDETARETTWFAPAAHYLESWGDARAYDGTASLIQPLIAPMYDGRTVAEILALISGDSNTHAHDLLRRSWSASHSGGQAFDAWWNESVARGTISGSAAATTTPPVRWDAVGAAHARLVAPQAESAMSIQFVASGAVHDGRFADNGWLQELPDAVTKLTWDNALLVGPAYATRAKLVTGDQVHLGLRDRTVTVPIVIVPGHANDAVTLPMGYGRSGAEAVARGVGVNANAIRTSGAPFVDTGVTLAATGAHRALAITQAHWSLEGRGVEILGVAVADSAHPAPPTTPPKQRRPLTLYEPAEPSRDGFGADQWAMVIDLNTCTGCGACVVACQAENNIPVVGRDSVLKSREMQWIRLDRYIEGALDAPKITVQPMLCQQCEKAPCEYVCPVDATVHSDDGLNEMVYNRCVGTRFCSNNCPYKVRRFNWFDYNYEIAETERMVKNPEVTVRARGVMEKCTFCVQRIRHAQVEAEIANAPHTGPVVTACQQTCPTGAIVFGSLTNPQSEVVRQREDPRCFSALDSLGTVPRVRYLARTSPSELADSESTSDRSNG